MPWTSKPLALLAGLLALFTASSCGQSDRPFSYHYSAADEVAIIMNNVTYTLKMGEAKPEGLPFDYEFEADGDLDLIIEGERYEIDSPYDRDSKSKKRTTKKKTTKKKRRR